LLLQQRKNHVRVQVLSQPLQDVVFLHHPKRISGDVSVSVANGWSFGRRSPLGRSERVGDEARQAIDKDRWWQTDALLTDRRVSRRSFIYIRTSPHLSIEAPTSSFSPSFLLCNSQTTYCIHEPLCDAQKETVVQHMK
jgi:hypothetical protein